MFCLAGASLTGVLVGASASRVMIGADNNFADCGTPVVVNGALCLNRYRSLAIAAPGAGATVAMTMSAPDLLLNPAGTLATLTVQMPPAPGDGQVARVTATAAVTALTLTTPDGAIMANAATTLPAGASLARRYYAPGNIWYPSG